MLWLDGRIYEGNEVPFDATDRGLLLGDGVFDTSLIISRRMFLREAHLGRLLASCEAFGIAVDAGNLMRGLDAILARVTDAALRITVTRGPGPRGLVPREGGDPTILISADTLSVERLYSPVKIHPVAVRRNDTSPMSRHKTLNCLDAVWGQREASTEGADEPLFLNTRDRVTCAGTGNIFALREGALLTPPVEDGVLPGTVRGYLLAKGSEAGVTVREQSLSLADVLGADMVLMTNSLRLAAPVTAVGGTQFGSSELDIFRSIQSLLRDAVRIECGTPRWTEFSIPSA